MKKTVAKVGFYSMAAAFIAAAGFGVVQIMQVLGVLTYPLDLILIFGFSLAIAAPFLLGILALHYTVQEDHKFWSHAALLFAVLYTVYVVLMYAVQLATVIPMSMKDQSLNILTVTPHSFFWTIDALGYICMGTSTLFAAFVFNKNASERWLRRFLLANAFVVPLIAFAYFYPHFSNTVLFVGSPWIITAPGSMLLMAFYFRRICNKAP
ncbi:MAG: hypothetical protein ACXVJD_14845 [Mucilaginibacter sp.]